MLATTYFTYSVYQISLAYMLGGFVIKQVFAFSLK